MARQQEYFFSFGPSFMQRMRTLADLALRRFGMCVLCNHFGFEFDADGTKTLRNTSNSSHPDLGDCHHILVVPCTCHVLVDPILLPL